MSVFSRKAPEQTTQQQVQSKFHLILDDYDVAFRALDHASHLLSTLILETEKMMKYIDKYRSDLTKAVATTDPQNIEEAIKDYIPKAHRTPEEGQDQ